MKVYFSLPTQSRGVGRAHKALIDYAPKEIEVVDDPNEADLTVVHVIGRFDHVNRITNWLKRHNKAYAIVQYCIRSTKNPSTEDWMPIWADAEVVWSYYNLPELCKEDKTSSWMSDKLNDLPYGNFYYAPLGVDARIFTIQSWGRPYIIATCSPHALAEGVRECWMAAQRVGREMFHLGEDLRRPGVKSDTNISDGRLAHYYNKCEFVSGLRRTEGFELPVIEGLLCGARPIVYDAPHYRAWFDEFAIFVKEGNRDDVANSLEAIFRQGSRPITKKEAELVIERFDWSKIIAGFWDRILS